MLGSGKNDPELRNLYEVVKGPILILFALGIRSCYGKRSCKCSMSCNGCVGSS